MTTQDKNAEIARWMGMTQGKPNESRWKNDWFEKLTVNGNEFESGRRHTHLHFDSDWNWLMLCVEKIESLGVSVNIKATWNNFHNCTYTQTSIKMEKGEFTHSKQCFCVHDIVYHSHSDTEIKKIDSVYESVYQFVVWHNQQQK